MVKVVTMTDNNCSNKQTSRKLAKEWTCAFQWRKSLASGVLLWTINRRLIRHLACSDRLRRRCDAFPSAQMNFDSTPELDSVLNGYLYSNNICIKHYRVRRTSALPRNAALRADRLPSFFPHRGNYKREIFFGNFQCRAPVSSAVITMAL